MFMCLQAGIKQNFQVPLRLILWNRLQLLVPGFRRRWQWVLFGWPRPDCLYSVMLKGLCRVSRWWLSPSGLQTCDGLHLLSRQNGIFNQKIQVFFSGSSPEQLQVI